MHSFEGDDGWRFDAEVQCWEAGQCAPSECTEREFWGFVVADIYRRARVAGAIPPEVFSKDAAHDDLEELIRKGMTIESQDWLAGRWGVGKSTVSRWLKDWEMNGGIIRPRAGRTRMIQAN